MSNGKAIEIKNVSKIYGKYHALTPVNFHINDNEFFTLLGPSGCGKTTLLRMIAGFEQPTQGSILLRGQDIANQPPHKRRVNTVFQNYALFPHMTLYDNIAYSLQNLKWEQKKAATRVEEMLNLVHMGDYAARYPAELSGGQRQRIALARALAPEPEVLLLDEPLSALDLKLRQAMRNELRQLQRKTGITFIFVTHDQEEALDMSDRICVLGNGRIQQIGAPSEIYEFPENKFVADFIGATNFFDVTISSVKDDKAEIKLPFCAPIFVNQQNLSQGSKTSASLRPEKINFILNEGDITVDGTIIDVNYLGAYTQYSISVGDSILCVSKRNNVSGDPLFQIGSTTRIGFSPNSVRILRS
ncbi:ABC transporter ATP-binding protein [Bartonella sp. HY406]|uniref:ABC transporter ATP-binding protein n=1 Tax=Bartonella sp. HY406 TaxID=2979331 RepID=UPI0021C8D8F0|nr:ABC transporter ATP-binding protein [Bartonella sp. HY406]UXN03624.1 ABC transporter ATP-binding protein [Bartonella sp. HY406]